MCTLKFISLGIIMLLLGSATCACNKSPGQVGATSETINYGVRLNIASDKVIYHPGDTVHITVSAENITQEPIEFPLLNDGYPPIYVHLDATPYALQQNLVEKDYEPGLVNESVVHVFLEPKQSIQRKVIWDEQISTNPDEIQAPAGTYRIGCDFAVGHYSYENKPPRVSTSIEIQVEGSWQIIVPDKALEIARNIPNVASWVTGHSGPNVVKYEDGQYYLYIDSGWQKVDASIFGSGKATTEEIQQRYVPDENVLMVANRWEVHFFTKMGPAPNEVIVKIEPTTGAVLSVEEGK